MSKADKMFEDLGYEKYEVNVNEYFEYTNKNEDVKIILMKGSILIKTNSRLLVDAKPTVVYAKEIQAINEKVKELGWEE